MEVEVPKEMECGMKSLRGITEGKKNQSKLLVISFLVGNQTNQNYPACEKGSLLLSCECNIRSPLPDIRN